MLAVFATILSATTAQSHPSDHAPLGVMGDHTHREGEWMASYRYGRMEMSGNRNGSKSVSTDQVLSDFMVAPLNMTMDMHMFGLMYAPSDRLTLMAMTSYNEKSMEHVNRMGVRFRTEAEGLGDTRLTGLLTLGDPDVRDHKLHLNLGLSLPTGSIDERDATPAGAAQKLPYPMQLGSGTWDPILGLTYTGRDEAWSWGAQGLGILRFGENSEGYRLGNEYTATSWIARDLNRYTSVLFRLEGKIRSDIDGRDSELNPMMVPTARTDLRGSKQLDALIGVNLYQPEGSLKGQRLALEAGMPVYQHLDGPQLETDYRIMLGWQASF